MRVSPTTVVSPSLTGTSRAAVSGCLNRVAERDCEVRAWAHLDRHLALRYATEADQAEPVSPLHGVPVGLKDIIDTADQPTSYGSPAWIGHRPQRDAESVRRLRAAGAVIMGKTTTTEFATYQPTLTMNPHDQEHTPGGSSSGSAAAVADGQVQIALGTQTAGSVNRPGSFCGVFTLKPTYGRWPFAGVLPVALSFDTLGGFARDPRDLGRLDTVLSSPRADGAPARTRALPPLSELRVGVVRGPWFDRAEPAAADMLAWAAGQLGALAGEVRDVAVPAELAALQDAHADIQSLEAGWYLRDMIARNPDKVSELLKGHIAAAQALDADQQQLCRAALRDARAFARDALSEVDVLITLAAPGEAPHSLESTGDPAFNRLASTAGLPAAGLPVGTGERGLPLGLQIIGPPHADRSLMELVITLTHDVGLAAVPALPGRSE
jgi:Asp-tRNA(Asn)/Glu-tRNA(Gln) amidotransferase A subunit family amidase